MNGVQVVRHGLSKWRRPRQVVVVVDLVQERAAAYYNKCREEPIRRAVGRLVRARLLRAFDGREAAIGLLAADAADAAVDQGHGFVGSVFVGVGSPTDASKRHSGARLVARDQSLSRVLAFDGGSVR